MKIDRNNYESFFIDYLEGNLDELIVNDFIEFIQQNPDLKEELSMFDSVSLEPEKMEFPKKAGLYKEKFDLEKEFNHAAIAKMEGDLTKSEKQKFDNYLLRHPEKQKEDVLFGKTKLHADKSIVFRNKSKIYHRPSGRTILLWASRVAAVIILILAVYFYIDNLQGNVVPKNQFAKIDEQPVKKETPAEINLIPIETGKKGQNLNVEKKNSKPAPVLKNKTILQPEKNLRKNTKVQIEPETIVEARIQEKAPAKINGIAASIHVRQPEMMLAEVKQNLPVSTTTHTESERLLADVVKEKTGLDHLSLNKITKAGLNLVSTISKDKFTYETNNNGRITEVSFDTRLLAFSIPTKNEGNGE